MPLYEIPRGSKILLPIGDSNRETKDELCTFHHVDGMYSLITTESGDVVHLSRFVRVQKVGDHYEILPTTS